MRASFAGIFRGKICIFIFLCFVLSCCYFYYVVSGTSNKNRSKLKNILNDIFLTFTWKQHRSVYFYIYKLCSCSSITTLELSLIPQSQQPHMSRKIECTKDLESMSTLFFFQGKMSQPPMVSRNIKITKKKKCFTCEKEVQLCLIVVLCSARPIDWIENQSKVMQLSVQPM